MATKALGGDSIEGWHGNLAHCACDIYSSQHRALFDAGDGKVDLVAGYGYGSDLTYYVNYNSVSLPVMQATLGEI